MGGKSNERERSRVGAGKRRPWLPKSRLEYVYYVLAVLVAATVLFSFLRGSGGGETTVAIEPIPHVAPVAGLKAVDLLVEDEVGRYPFHSRVEATLHNTGGRLAVITRARIKVLHVFELPLCFTQGGVPVSGSYGVPLPVDAQAGELVEAPLHQQVGADEADRFALNLSVEGADLKGVYLFDLDISLVNDGSTAPLPLGRVVVSLPETPTPQNYVWREGDGESLNETFNPYGYPVREFWAENMLCWRENTKRLRRAFDGPATHSPELADIAEGLVTPTYAALAAGIR
jgi:hypothetical protein